MLSTTFPGVLKLRATSAVSARLATRARFAIMLGGGGDNFAAAASALFANIRLPASILAGALIPLGFGFALPTEGAAFTAQTRLRFIQVHRVIAVISYASLLVSIVYASVAINSLAENAHESASSVSALIMREYDLAWVATNCNFLFGLYGALVLIALRALLTWELAEGRVATGFCSAALLLITSVVDEQVRAGGYADDLLQLVAKYVTLTVTLAAKSHSPLLCLGLVATAGSTVAAGQLLLAELPSSSAGCSTTSQEARALSTVESTVVASAANVAASEAVLTAAAPTADTPPAAAPPDVDVSQVDNAIDIGDAGV